MIVVTGGAGFIGSAVIHRLNSLGIDDILVVDNLGSGEKWRNLVRRRYRDYVHRDKFIELVRAGALPGKAEAIIHLGARSATTEEDADFLMENNFHYSRDLCRFALDSGARFINASSAATYGAGERGFDDDPAALAELRPLNKYGYSKHLFDLWLAREGLLNSAASLKFFNVYGPNEYHKGSMRSVAVKLFHEINETGVASLFASGKKDVADGEQKRDFVYVKDCADLVAWLTLDAPGANGVINVGTGRARSFNALARAVFAATGRPAKINYVPTPANVAANYQYFTQATPGGLERVGYKGKFLTLEAGVQDYVQNYLAADDKYL